ncbi:MAG: asparagine synthase (glutamine-hydrolyzing) [Myxococcota bacterium]
MCGIAGYVGPRRHLDSRVLLDALASRGPDGEGTFEEEGSSWSAVLCHRRLAVIDPTARAAQPMLLGKTHALVFNGEVFNHAELRVHLEQRGHHFRTRSDTEVLLHGLVEEGPDFVERLRGPFAFAFLERSSGRLILGRDRLGVNPLYVSHVPGGGIAFSSTVDALMHAGLTSHELNLRGLCGYLFYGSVPEPLTLLQDVEELPPGMWWRVSPDGGIRRRRYWRLPAESSSGVDAAARVREALQDAVKAEMVSDVPVAVLLSSGIDSAAVAALASAQSREELRAFTVGFPGGDGAVDETLLAAETARSLGCQHAVVKANVSSGGKALLDAAAAQDLPSIDGTNTYLVSQAIRRAGFKVALSGLGGDELFLGYGNRRTFHRLRQVSRGALPRGAGWAAARLARALGVSTRVERAVFAAMQPRGLVGAYAAVRTVMGPATLLSLLHPEVRGGVMPEDLDPVTYLSADSLPVDPDGALSRLELSNYLRSTLLKDSNILSLANGVELRVPLMDWKLVEAVLALPGHVRAAGTPPKPLLREALQGILPDGLERRPKVGFVLPLSSWLGEASSALPTSYLQGVMVPETAAEPLPIRLARAFLSTFLARRATATAPSRMNRLSA